MSSIGEPAIALIFFNVIQLISTFQRLIFDFLGFQYVLIIFNFGNLVFSFIGLFGAFHRRIWFLGIFAIWSVLYICFNLFVICFYLEIGILRREQIWLLSLVESERTWWFQNLCGPKVSESNTSSSLVDSSLSISTMTSVAIPRSDQIAIDCIFPFYYAEVIQAGVQVLLSFCSFICSLCAATRLYNKEFLETPSYAQPYFNNPHDPYGYGESDMAKNRQSYRNRNRGHVVDALSVESFTPDSGLPASSFQQRALPSQMANGRVHVDSGVSNESLNDQRPLVTSQAVYSSQQVPGNNWPVMTNYDVPYQISPRTTATSTVRSSDSFRIAVTGNQEADNGCVRECIPMRPIQNMRGHGNAAYLSDSTNCLQSSYYNQIERSAAPDNATRPSPYVFIPPAR